LISVWLLAAGPVKAASALSLDPENPHYFRFRGKPTIIVSSGEHYGAVLNLDFDYTRYLNTLSQDGLNGTRTWVGAYCEPYGAFRIVRNTLAPKPNRFICPWARSRQPGYQNGGNKFDLSKWDNAYFKRLKDFVYQAGKRGIIVEVNLFCPFYEESMWQLSPMNALNNINGVGTLERTNVYTLDRSHGLLSVQEALARKVVTELSRFDNLYYEICNEPYFGGVTLEWQQHLENVIAQTETGLGRPHLVSRNIANEKAKVEDPEATLSILNFHYASPPDAVALNYDLNRVIGDNETGFRGTGDAPYRMEAWDFIVAGGALFNNLDYSFTAGQEDGTFSLPASQPGGGGPTLRRQLRFLGQFMRRFDLVHLEPQPALIVGGVPDGMTARVLGQPGKDYIVYLRSAPQATQNGHPPATTFAEGQVVLEAALPPGQFKAQWFDPKDGSLLRSEDLLSATSLGRFSLPAFEDDVVLAIRQAAVAPIAKAPAPAPPAAAPAPATNPAVTTNPVPVPEKPLTPAVVAETPTPDTNGATNQVKVAKPNWWRRLFGAGTSSPGAQPKPDLARTEEAPHPSPTPPPGTNDAGSRMSDGTVTATTPPPPRTEIPEPKTLTPPQEQPQTAQPNTPTPPPPEPNPPKANRMPVPQVWVDAANPPPSIVPPLARAEIPKPRTITPPQEQPQTAQVRTATPPSALAKAAKTGNTAVPRVWIEQADVSQAQAAMAPRLPSPRNNPQPSQARVGGFGTIRMDAWDLVLAGGVSPRNLDESIAAGPAMDGETARSVERLRAQLRFLSDFARGFDTARMREDTTLITDGVPAEMTAHVLAKPAQDYIVYLRPTGPQPRGNARSSRNRQVVLGLNLPAGRYGVEWLDPRRAMPISYQQLTHSAGVARLAAPPFGEDVVLALRRE
jgi:hypothetical protein